MHHQQIISLQAGSVFLYHESVCDKGDQVCFLICVKGSLLPSYFDFLSKQTNYPLGELKRFGEIIYHSTTRIMADEIQTQIRDYVGSI